MRVVHIALVLLAAIGLIQGASAEEDRGCSNASLHGGYGLRATGNTTSGGAQIVLGRFEFDGRGNLTAKLFTRTPTGANVADTYTGTYSVDADCIVTDYWKADTSGAVTTHVSVIVNKGKGYFVLNTTEGAPVIISGEGRKQ